MSMHLARGLTTTGKRRGKQKFASAEAKRQHMQLQQDWSALKSKWGATDSGKRKNNVAVELPTVAKSAVRDTGPRPSSLNSWVVGPAVKRETQQYTGDKMVGIGTMHKSNAVPIFSNQEAVDIAKMRRG